MIFFKILTLFPSCFPGPLGCGLVGKNLYKTWGYKAYSLVENQSFIDDTPCGGGPGMVIKPTSFESFLDGDTNKKIYLSPRGKPLNNQLMENYKYIKDFTLICGRYEGIDQRVIDYYDIDEISIGDYILCGGEVAAMVFMECFIRMYGTIVHNPLSLEQDSFSNFLLEADQYTKPNSWKNLAVPCVLLSGNHRAIDTWKLANSLEKTRCIRPDLYEKYIVNLLFLLVAARKIKFKFSKH